MADIAQTEDTNHPLALIDHRQSADLQLLHVLHGLGEVVVITAAMDAWCHHITRRRAVGIEVVLRQTFADDVSVGHHTDETVVLSDWNSADIVLAHQFCQFGDRSIWANPVDAVVHRVFDFHGGPPRARCMMKCTIGPPPSTSIYNFGALWKKGRIRLWRSAGAIIESRCGCLLSPCCEPYPTSKEFLDSVAGPSACRSGVRLRLTSMHNSAWLRMRGGQSCDG